MRRALPVRSGRLTRATISLFLAVAFLATGLGGLATPASAATARTATVAGLPTAWAYGANETIWYNTTNQTGNYQASVYAYLGFQVLLNQTNVSANQTLVEIQRAVAFDFAAQYCSPTCSNPSGEINATYRAWQTAVGFANFTNGSVQGPTGEVPAVAVQNASTRVQGNLTEKFSTGARGLFGGWKTGSDYLTVQAGGTMSLAFTPALGLYPTNLDATPIWSSSSSYAASGSWSAAYTWDRIGLTGNVSSGHGSPSGSLTTAGVVGVVGTSGNSVTLDDRSVTRAVDLVLSGPFALREGLLFVPSLGDVFGSSQDQSWSTYADGAGPASTSAVNVGPAPGHLGQLASATSFESQDNAAIPAPSAGPATFVGATSIAATPQAQQTLQGQPEAVPAAEGQSSCLTAGSCPGQNVHFPNTTPAQMRLIGALVVGLVVAVLAVLIVLGVVAKRRQVPPPPPRQNSGLYPSPASGPTSARPATGPRSPGSGTPPVGDDPLSNLW